MVRGRRIRVNYRLDESLVEQLKKRALSEGRPAVKVLEEAIKDYFSEESEQTAIEGTFHLVSRLEGRSKGIRTDLESMTDLFCFFIYHWFCHTPALPDGLKAEAAASGMARYHRFIEMLKRKRLGGESLAKLYLETPSSPSSESS